MTQFRMDSEQQFDDVISCFSEFVDGVVLQITPSDGLRGEFRTSQGDVGGTVTVPPNTFPNIDGPGTEFALDLTRFEPNFKQLVNTGDGKLNAKVTDDYLKLQLGKASITQRLADTDRVRTPTSFPNIEFDTSVILSGDDFGTLCTAVENFSEYTRFESSADADNCFTVYAESDQQQEAYEIEFSQGQLLGGTTRQCESMFLTESLKSVSKSLGKTEKVKLEFSDGTALRIRADIADGYGVVTYFVTRAANKSESATGSENQSHIIQ